LLAIFGAIYILQPYEVLTVNGYVNGHVNGDISSDSDSDINGHITNGYNSDEADENSDEVDEDNDEADLHCDRNSITGMSKVSISILWYLLYFQYTIVMSSVIALLHCAG